MRKRGIRVKASRRRPHERGRVRRARPSHAWLASFFRRQDAIGKPPNNCIHPGTTRTERTPSLVAARATQLGVSPEEAERRDFAPDSPRGNSICRMVDASEVAFVAVFLASEKAWAVSGELVAAGGGAGRSVYY